MFGTCTKIHVCQVVTWNMCYSATCLCTFVFSCYFSAPDTFQLARRVFPAKYIEGSRAKKLQYSQSSANFDLQQRSISNIPMTFKPLPSAPVHSNLETKRRLSLFFLLHFVRLQARSVSSESTFTLSSLSVRRFCHYRVVTAEKSPGSLRVPKPNTICLKDKSERDVILIKINLCWHSLGPVASAFFIACFDNVIKDGFRLLIKFSKLVRLPLRNFMDSSFVF